MDLEHEERLSRVEERVKSNAKRWEGIADKTVWAVLAAVIAFLLGRIGL